MKKSIFVLFALLMTALTANAVEEAVYYVTGEMTSWAVDKSYQLTRNTDAPDGVDEFMITLDLQTTDMFKIVKSTNGIDVETWYPAGMENAYGEHGEITKNGKYTIYFRPAGNSDPAWFNGFFYVTEASGTSLDAVVGGQGKSVKFMENGQLFLLRDGKTYTVQGQEVR